MSEELNKYLTEREAHAKTLDVDELCSYLSHHSWSEEYAYWKALLELARIGWAYKQGKIARCEVCQQIVTGKEAGYLDKTLVPGHSLTPVWTWRQIRCDKCLYEVID